jgi:hypothetical protein
MEVDVSKVADELAEMATKPELWRQEYGDRPLPLSDEQLGMELCDMLIKCRGGLCGSSSDLPTWIIKHSAPAARHIAIQVLRADAARAKMVGELSNTTQY